MQTQAGSTHLSFQVWPNTAAAAAALHSATSSTLLLNFMDLIFLITWHRAVLCCWGRVMACDFIMSGTLPSSAVSLWHGHSKLWMINCNEINFLFAACSPRPWREKMSGREYFQCSAVAILVQDKKIYLQKKCSNWVGNFVGVLHVTRFQQKRPWLSWRPDLSQGADCRL